ncbi:MAG: GNAT family N-acetyltransferase [Desulfovibrionaceae bacterium]|jgi:ribosomal protein S18 acetylase RimI-like enzyme|nr:GNAT family N-acetyltransferase [Desulfovibrionaceae bacterium]
MSNATGSGPRAGCACEGLSGCVPAPSVAARADAAAVEAFREEPVAADAAEVRAITTSTGAFAPAEVDVAVELVEERLAKGPASGYFFLFADAAPATGRAAGAVDGYACFGPIACTVSSYDLYWIAVRQDLRGSGLGTRLLAAAEARIRAMGGTRIYVETSSRPDYAATRGFYVARGYRVEGVFEDFYAPGDHKVVYVRVLGPGAAIRS